ncbi:CitMHS family citrate-Mg2+:H+ or citrate-Ca2+:H+ symporter [Propionibacteriaceae bacterium ES.041]|uniref:CitMHS family transporter n=1 Tax=Enemella evansiae TaxID=2016499 RepID=UPI000B968FA2|nr:SLC13 family permease [Enemella evansiae]OYN96140.1 citrate transporter [Enemella evansiae]PFG65361.1 CitMHS family citrate-Mg2+:H+ or citrate-Ca2+:H+ symporter [Propionibacteriaceae bacterium ES.041]
MLTLMGFLAIAVILVLLLTNRVAAVVALAGVPVVAALIAGFGFTDIGKYAAAGIKSVAPTAAMFIFAIVFFGVLRDAGMFDPIIKRLVGVAGNAPVKVCFATTLLAICVHLDGAGATTFLIAIPAMLPVFDKLRMSRLALTTCVGLGAGVMNLLPWGGPTARAATTVKVPANELWIPLIPAQIAGIIAALVFAVLIGRREQRRIARLDPVAETVGAAAVGGGGADAGGAGGASRVGGPPEGSADDNSGGGRSAGGSGSAGEVLSEEDRALRRPKLFWFNVILTVVVIGAMIATVSTPELIFLCGVVIALLVNFPGLKQQTKRIEAHSHGAMLMATTLLAAGVFLGILEGTRMIDAMAQSVASLIPQAAGPALPLIVGILGVPLSLLFGPDPYYFGVLPVLAGVGQQLGVSPVDLAQASLLGQETVGFPISPLTGSFYLLVGLAGVDIGRHIRSLIGWAWAASLIMLAVAMLTGAVPLWAN